MVDSEADWSQFTETAINIPAHAMEKNKRRLGNIEGVSTSPGHSRTSMVERSNPGVTASRLAIKLAYFDRYLLATETTHASGKPCIRKLVRFPSPVWAGEDAT